MGTRVFFFLKLKRGWLRKKKGGGEHRREEKAETVASSGSQGRRDLILCFVLMDDKWSRIWEREGLLFFV